MNTKDNILKILEENRDKYMSGEVLAKELSLSRTSIWKAVKSLKEQGYEIKSSTNKGYKIDERCDKLSSFGIKNYLIPQLKDIDIYCYETIDSTNTQAKRLLYSKDLENFTVLISDEQTKGRGRKGRSFSSPKGSGIYMTIILFPKDNFKINSFDLITVRAANAVVNAIKSKTDKEPKIKWVNDIFLNHKKICGILSEADYDFESKQIKSIIIGIGLNFSTDLSAFSKELRPIVGSLLPKDLLRNEFIGEILNEFYKACYEQQREEILKIYKDNSLLLGRSVSFEKDSKKYEATAIDINENGNLIVELEDGSIISLSSGEVSVKGQF
ncbi:MULTISPECIES: biotin--[acetyl-CoA-carboxylase] ligase [Peptoniphilus]|uniref:biotin--[acetyl-CoA-carboxylase] ligase n=1 Tax=Peptoniphilus TaxID=162289 RepID=UPI0001DA9A84|nr:MULTISPECIES: biotin--[acetyl-CoA-carboxylase] ligase [Peptoniphilus]EFI41950.1 biotin--[acetyl-CoA-carboxylase] ligase [Peptoniphilus sp. oral taxon 386 str. F0131]